MVRREIICLLAFLVVLVMDAGSARADFITISQPTATYTSITNKIPITGSDYSSINSISDGTLTVSFSSAVNVNTVPSGGWSTWGSPPDTESSTPRVLAAATNLTLTLSQPVYIFGFEAEPNRFGFYNITVSFYDNVGLVGTISQNVDGNAGAKLFAAQTSTNPFTTVVISAPSGALGFAIAQLRYRLNPLAGAQPVPEPGTMLLFGTGVIGALGALRRRTGKGR